MTQSGPRASPARPPAVAVMARVPGSGPVKTRLHAAVTAAGATELYRCFLLDRLDALAAVPGIHPLVAFAPAEAELAIRPLAPAAFELVPQHPGDLGERLATLLVALLARGHAGAIAMDSDSPTLPMRHVAEAAAVLAAGRADVVLGPSDDGGYYLVGVASPCPSLFAGIPWSTDAVFAVTAERAARAGLSVHVLPRCFDVDTEADLARLARELPATGGPAPRTAALLRTWQYPAAPGP
jgi:rSAM/selenodomain-associated transferase 1